MKVLEFFKKKWVIQLIGLIALSVLIWFLGPLIAIGGVTPLESAATRLIVILVLAMLWISLLFLGYVKAQKKEQGLIEEISSEDDQPDDSQLTKEELDQIHDRFDEALQIIKKSGSGSQNQYLYELPWYVIIGPPGSGKTTALINSELQFPVADELGTEAIRGVGGTRNCDWWFTNNAVLIDTAGRYTTQDSHASVDSSAWKGFLQLLKSKRTHQPINGALIAISLHDLMTLSDHERELHAKAIRNRVQELHEELGVQFPIYVLFTKCDLVAGFNEFFSSLGAEERKQVWGTTFDFNEDKDAEPSITSFDHRFDALLSRIHERMIDKINQERDIEKRAQIFSFPQQIGNLKQPIKQFLDTAFSPSRFTSPPQVRGFYFTSGTQEGTPIDRLMGSVASTFGLDRTRQAAFSGKGRSYFINRLFQQVIFEEANLAGTNKKHEKRRRLLQISAYAISAVILVSGLSLWAISYSKNQQLLLDLQTSLNQYQAAIANQPYQQTELDQLEPALAHLRNATELYPDPVPLMLGMGLYQGSRMQPTAQDTYNRVLGTRFLYSLGKRLEQLIGDNIDKPDVLSIALRAYLMLGDPNKLQQADVSSLMVADWSNQYGNQPQLITKLTQHLDSLLESRFDPLPLDQGLVTQARETLTRTRLSEQIYNRVIADEPSYQSYTLDVIALFGSKANDVMQARSGSVNNLSMPGLFTTAGFKNVFLKELDTLAESSELEFWIRGEDSSNQQGQSQQDVLKQELLEYYVDDYIRHWRELLNSVQIRQANSLQSSADLLDAASSSNSPIRKILQAIEANTNLVRAKKETQTPVDDATKNKLAAAANTAAVLSTTVDTRQNQLQNLIGSASGFKENNPDITLQRVDDTFGAISKLVAKRGDAPAPIDPLLSDLYNLFTYLSDLADSGSTGEAALAAMKSDRNPANQLKRKVKDFPEPIKSWFLNFSSGSQNAVASRSKGQLSQVWGADVIPFCKRGIEKRYPLAKGSDVDITLEDFSRFFGPGQMMDKFFVENVQPFVDTSRNPWRWKQGKRPSISTRTLAQFEAADSIRNAFFSTGSAEPQVRFTLKPVKLDNRIASFALTIGNQNIVYRHGPIVPKRFTWPAPNGSGTTRMLFQTNNKKDLGASYEGTWGLFKLLDKADVKATKSADKFKLTFKQGKYTAEFELQASSVNNPFSLKALKTFQCRSRL